ncbi:TldD/PmbA family protein, partial [Methanosarcinales archaeon]
RSAATDDEGTPSQRTRVIEDGVLQTYLYDKYTADQDETMSTANAIRYTYNQTPVISTRNFTIQYPDSRVIEETDEGVIIHTLIGAHTANPITGDFSVEARNSFIIRGGEITEPIKTLMIPGNIFGLLQNISGAGSDVKNLGSIITPTLRIENTKIV